MGDITTDTSKIERDIRDYYKQLYSKENHLQKMDKFLETYNLPKLNQEKIKSLNKPKANKEIESVTKNL